MKRQVLTHEHTNGHLKTRIVAHAGTQELDGHDATRTQIKIDSITPHSRRSYAPGPGVVARRMDTSMDLVDIIIELVGATVTSVDISDASANDGMEESMDV